MVYKENDLTRNPQKTIALNFGFKENFKWEDTKKTKLVKNTDGCTCRMCGRVQEQLLHDPENDLIGPKSNDMYSYKDKMSSYVCTYCYYISKIYMKKAQKNLEVQKGDVANVIVYNKKIDHISFISDEKNELYDLFVKPPKEAFIILGKNMKGASFENEAYTAMPTISSELFCYNHKRQPFMVSRKKVLSCAKEANEIMKAATKRKFNLAAEVLFNRMTQEAYNLFYTGNLRRDPEMSRKIADFVTKYDQGTRFVAKVIFKRYLGELKNKESKKNKRE